MIHLAFALVFFLIDSFRMVSRRKSSRLAADAVPCRRCHVRKLGVHFAFGVIQVIMRVFRIRLAVKLRIHFSFCIIPVIMGMAGVRFPRNGAVHLLFGEVSPVMVMPTVSLGRELLIDLCSILKIGVVLQLRCFCRDAEIHRLVSVHSQLNAVHKDLLDDIRLSSGSFEAPYPCRQGGKISHDLYAKSFQLAELCRYYFTCHSSPLPRRHEPSWHQTRCRSQLSSRCCRRWSRSCRRLS